MLSEINLPLILIAAFAAAVSPGPATLSLAGTSMSLGRSSGFALASGITLGSWIWSISAALGLGAIMLANAWMFEVIRYFGAVYLLYLAYRALRSALSGKEAALRTMSGGTATLFSKGLLLHLTNPKAVLFFGSLYTLGVPVGSSLQDLTIVILAVGVQSTILFHLYAVLFSSSVMTKAYLRLRPWFDGGFALGFGAAGVKILTTKLNPS